MATKDPLDDLFGDDSQQREVAIDPWVPVKKEGYSAPVLVDIEKPEAQPQAQADPLDDLFPPGLPKQENIIDRVLNKMASRPVPEDNPDEQVALERPELFKDYQTAKKTGISPEAAVSVAEATASGKDTGERIAMEHPELYPDYLAAVKTGISPEAARRVAEAKFAAKNTPSSKKTDKAFFETVSKYQEDFANTEKLYSQAKPVLDTLDSLKKQIDQFSPMIQDGVFNGSEEQFGEYKNIVKKYQQTLDDNKDILSKFDEAHAGQNKAKVEAYNAMVDSYKKYQNAPSPIDSAHPVVKLLDTLGKATMSGFGQMGQAAGTIIESVGMNAAMPGSRPGGVAMIPNLPYGTAKKIEDAGENVRLAFNHLNKTYYDFSKNIRGDKLSERIKDPNYWVGNIGNMAPGMLSTIGAGAGAGQIIGKVASKLGVPALKIAKMIRVGQALVGGAAGGTLEGSSTYQQMLDSGHTKEEAETAALLMAGGSAILNAVSVDRMLKVLPKNAKAQLFGRIMSGAAESVTEWLEEPHEAISMEVASKGPKALIVPGTYQKALQALKEGADVIGPSFILGALGGGAGDENAQKPAVPPPDQGNIPNAPDGGNAIEQPGMAADRATQPASYADERIKQLEDYFEQNKADMDDETISAWQARINELKARRGTTGQAPKHQKSITERNAEIDETISNYRVLLNNPNITEKNKKWIEKEIFRLEGERKYDTGKFKSQEGQGNAVQQPGPAKVGSQQGGPGGPGGGEGEGIRRGDGLQQPPGAVQAEVAPQGEEAKQEGVPAPAQEAGKAGGRYRYEVTLDDGDVSDSEVIRHDDGSVTVSIEARDNTEFSPEEARGLSNESLLVHAGASKVNARKNKSGQRVESVQPGQKKNKVFRYDVVLDDGQSTVAEVTHNDDGSVTVRDETGFEDTLPAEGVGGQADSRILARMGYRTYGVAEGPAKPAAEQPSAVKTEAKKPPVSALFDETAYDEWMNPLLNVWEDSFVPAEATRAQKTVAEEDRKKALRDMKRFWWETMPTEAKKDKDARRQLRKDLASRLAWDLGQRISALKSDTEQQNAAAKEKEIQDIVDGFNDVLDSIGLGAEDSATRTEVNDILTQSSETFEAEQKQAQARTVAEAEQGRAQTDVDRNLLQFFRDADEAVTQEQATGRSVAPEPKPATTGGYTKQQRSAMVKKTRENIETAVGKHAKLVKTDKGWVLRGNNGVEIAVKLKPLSPKRYAYWTKYDQSITIDPTKADAGDVNHEITHALKDLGIITEVEWKRLVEVARKQQKKNMQAIIDLYEKEGIVLSEDDLDHEVVAKTIEEWRRGGAPVDMRNTFEKIRDFMRDLGNAIGISERGAQRVAEDVLEGKPLERKAEPIKRLDDTTEIMKFFRDSRYSIREPEGPPSERKTGIVDGDEVSAPESSYEAATRSGTNPWIRNSGKKQDDSSKSNAGRTLMVQFASSTITPSEDDAGSRYYDELYGGNRPGYDRMQDFWEIPQWMGFVANFVPKSDVYVVRNVDEANEFLGKSGYKTVVMSAIDVNKKLIKDLASKHPDVKFELGGYVDPSEFSGNKNIHWNNTMPELAETMGVKHVDGVDYRHFKGSKVIPRLTMSQGCFHKCAFCTVSKNLQVTPKDVVCQQAKAIAELGTKLVYLNDKTFGQASNYQDLAEFYKIIKDQNPDFQGFIVQTTAAQVRQIPAEWLKKSGIKYVELGVESYNDSILRSMKKPATVKIIDEAVQKLRDSKIRLIPNIIIGLPGETVDTYKNTIEFFKKNDDIISHANIYNLAVYKESELGKRIGAVTDADTNENAMEKSWHKGEEDVHRSFASVMYGMGVKPLSDQVESDMQRMSIREQTESPEFKKWFGKSKVVDENGEPKVLYHSTHTDWYEFDPAKLMWSSFGFHAGSSEQAAKVRFTGGTKEDLNKIRPVENERIMPIFLKIEKPLRMDDRGTWYPFDLVDRLEEKGVKDRNALTDNSRKESGHDAYHLGITWDKKTEARKKFDVFYKKAQDRIIVKNPDISRDELFKRTTLEARKYVRDIIENAGYDGIVYENKYEGEGDSWIAFRPEQIKSAIGNRGTFDPKNPDIRFSVRVTPEQDAAYMKAAESGDLKTAQRMVDEAAKKAGYKIKAFHGTDAEFNAFDPKYKELGFHFSKHEAVADERKGDDGIVLPVYLRGKFYDLVSDLGQWDDMAMLKEYLYKNEGPLENYDWNKIKTPQDVEKALKNEGYDGIRYINEFETPYDFRDTHKNADPYSYVVFDAQNIKRSDPITRDDSGRIIPLSERFNPKTADIRYSLREAEVGFDPTALEEIYSRNFGTKQDVRPKREASGRLKGAVSDDKIKLVHFGRPGQKKVSGEFFGSSGLTPRSELSGQPRGYFYEEGKINQFDPSVKGRPQYSAEVSGAKIYDGDRDILGYKGMVDRDAADHMLQEAGFEGIARTGRNRQGEFRQVEVFGEVPVEAAGERMSIRVTPEQDKEYMKAVKSGDIETAQKMVDEAAKKAGYKIKAFHGTSKAFTVFDQDMAGDNDAGALGDGFYFTTDPDLAYDYATERAMKFKRATGEVIDVFLKIRKPFIVKNSIDKYLEKDEDLAEDLGSVTYPAKAAVLISAFNKRHPDIKTEEPSQYAIGIAGEQDAGKDGDRPTAVEISDIIKKAGYDGIIYRFPAVDNSDPEMPGFPAADEIVVFDPSQIKSTDPIARDDSGKIIPLSKRFNPENDDIRYSIRQPSKEIMSYADEKKMPFVGTQPSYQDIPGLYHFNVPEAQNTTIAIEIGQGVDELRKQRAAAIARFTGKRNSIRKQTETPEFKKWFGKSKVVGENGDPLVVYHGTKKPISSFSEKRIGVGSTILGDYETERYGIFATPHEDIAEEFASQGEGFGKASIMPLFMRIENPFDMTDAYSDEIWNKVEAWADKNGYGGHLSARRLGNLWGSWKLFDKGEGRGILDPEIFIKMLKDLGYDGAKFYEPASGEESDGGISYVAFSPSQVKSATGNRGTFDSKDPDIRHSIRETDDRTGVTISRGQRRSSSARWLYDGETPRKFDRQVDFGEFMQREASKVARPRTQDTPENRSFVSGVLEHEARLATQSGHHKAMGWYDRMVKAARNMAALKFPELATDDNAWFAYTYALAVTSNGASIADNTKNAMHVYGKYRAKQKMPIFGSGIPGNAMKKAFQKWNEGVEKMGIEGWKKFMLSKHPVKDLMEVNPSIREQVSESVYGGTVIGSKVGGGFLQNLNGNFDALTMDRWFMRTWGRITGDLVETKRRRVMSQETGRWELDEPAPGLIDSPKNPRQRSYIRGTTNETLARLRKDYPNMTMADLQAILWYEEKDLYALHGVNDEEATDYATETEKFLQKQGIPSEDLARARAGFVSEQSARPDSGDQSERAEEVHDALPEWVTEGTRASIRDSKEARAVQVKSPEFKRWFGDWENSPESASKVVDDSGRPLQVYSGHANTQMYGTKYSPRKGTAGGFYTSEDPAVASGYSIGKLGVMEGYNNGDQYRLADKSGKLTKKLGQYVLSGEQKKKLDAILQKKDKNGEFLYDAAEMMRWARDYEQYEPVARRILSNPYNLENLWQFNEFMGYNIAYPEGERWQNDQPVPMFLRQRKNQTEQILDELGIEWNAFDWAQPGVMPVYLNIRNPLDADKPFPEGVLAALRQAAKRDRSDPGYEAHWTKEYPLKSFVEDIEQGREGWSTQVPNKAKAIFKQFGYDGIKERGNKGLASSVPRSERGINWIAFEPNQIKSSIGNKGSFDPSNPDIRFSVRVTPEQDAAYMKAAESGDTKTAQRMVDKAAKRAGYGKKTFHGIEGDRWKVFDINRDARSDGSDVLKSEFGRIFPTVSTSKKIADSYQTGGGEYYSLRTNLGDKIKTIDAKGGNWLSIEDEINDAVRGGSSAVVIKNINDVFDVGDAEGPEKSTTIILRDPNQIKLADPITRDDSGRIIPLSERFNPKTADIRYSARDEAAPEVRSAQALYEQSGAKSRVEFMSWLDDEGKEPAEIHRIMADLGRAAREPVGEREVRESKFATRLRQRFKDLEGVDVDYNVLDLEENVKKAEALVNERPVTARRVALGLSQPPPGMTAARVRLAYFTKMEQEGNTAEAARVAQVLSRGLTREGQEIASMRGAINDHDPIAFVRRVIAARTAKAGSRDPADVSKARKVVKQTVDASVKTMKAEVSKAQLSIQEAQKYLDSLICK